MKKIVISAAILIATNSFSQLNNTLPPTGPVGIGTDAPEPGQQLTVDGNAKMNGAVEINNNLEVIGQTVLNDVFRMPSLASFGGALDGFDIIVIDEFGTVAKTEGMIIDVDYTTKIIE